MVAQCRSSVLDAGFPVPSAHLKCSGQPVCHAGQVFVDLTEKKRREPAILVWLLNQGNDGRCLRIKHIDKTKVLTSWDFRLFENSVILWC
jgi:hypothetical protein